MKRPEGGRPNRRLGTRQERHVIKVHCEGKVTEPRYLLYLAKTYRSVHITIGSVGKDPLSLVGDARDDARLLGRRRRPDFDEVWAVFDVDEHPNLAQACNEARDSGVATAVSSPCFELWLVLHVQDQTAPIDAAAAQRLARDLGLTEGKAIAAAAWPTLLDRYEIAKERSIGLSRGHESADSGPYANPGTEVWRLVDIIRPEH